MNLGKKFEQQVKQDLTRCFPDSFILRLPDQQSGYYGTSQNICDFILFAKGSLFLLECKSHKGNTFPLSNLTQFGKLQQYKDVNGVKPGLILWFIDHDVVCWVPIRTIIYYIDAGKKSINIKDLDSDEFPIVKLNSEKKRTYLTTDYNGLFFI